MTVTVFGYLMLIVIDFNNFISLVFLSFRFEHIPNTQHRVSHISKHLEVPQKYSTEQFQFSSRRLEM